MALSERATFLVQRIQYITQKHDLHPVLPKLPIYITSAKETSIIKTPRVSLKPSVSFEGDAPKTPAVILFSKDPKQRAVTEGFSTSAQRKEAPDPIGEAYHLLQEIKSKIETLDGEYLKPGNPDLTKDIDQIKGMLKLKNKTFRAIAPDLIKLISELRPIMLADREALIFERQVESTDNLEATPLIARHKTLGNESEEAEASCFNLFAKCRYSYCQ
jgi:hypothetical protein